MTEEDFQEMRCLLEHGEQLNREDDVDGVLKTFRTSMRLFTKKSNAAVKSIVLDLQAYLVYFRDIAIRSSRRRDAALAEHWLIYRGMRTNDTEQITLLTHEHLDHSCNLFLLKWSEEKLTDSRLLPPATMQSMRCTMR